MKSTMLLFKNIPPTRELFVTARGNGRRYTIRLRSRDVGVDDSGRIWFVAQDGFWHGHLQHVAEVVAVEAQEIKSEGKTGV
jgi:hypothetical protein